MTSTEWLALFNHGRRTALPHQPYPRIIIGEDVYFAGQRAVFYRLGSHNDNQKEKDDADLR